ncbi:hypothetical protein SESBI_23758 [Sesbania bispinosa]|nr:hypothetical protein SESBI_23758 [Sesbania bispinosa]
MASTQAQKPSTAIEVCQPKTQHSSFGQKFSEITSKAFKGHHARHGSSPNQLQCNSQTQVESHGQNGSKTESHYYGHQTQTQHDKKHGVSKTQITVTVVQAQITQTHENPSPYGTTTNCFGGGAHAHAKKNGELNNNKKERNLFRRIKDGMSRHGRDGSSSSSDSESDNEKCPKTSKTKASTLKCTGVLNYILIKE